MGYGIINTSTLTAIADAIRSKLGVQATYKPSEMPEAIESISGGGITPTGTKSITANGTYDVASYASAEVNVPSVTPTGTKQISITANGTTTEDVASYADAEISVNVPQSGITPTGTKQVSVTQNGTTTEDVTNYANVEINTNVVNADYENALVALGVQSDLTNSITALTTYANGVTGESDSNLSDAVHTLGSGYSGGGTTYPFLVSYERVDVTEDLTSMTTLQFQNSYLPDLSTSAPYPTILCLIENTYTDSRYSAQAAIRLSSLSGSYAAGTSRFFVRSSGAIQVGNNSFGIGQGSVIHKYTFRTA